MMKETTCVDVVVVGVLEDSLMGCSLNGSRLYVLDYISCTKAGHVLMTQREPEPITKDRMGILQGKHEPQKDKLNSTNHNKTFRN